MPKPWSRVQVGYTRHPKFLALSGNAFSLWHEGKDYCDLHHTDGLIPHAAVKGFKFRGQASIEALMTSCGPKGDGTAYAPLWENHAVGFKMHDYLDHNPCREEALAHMALADAKREKDRARQSKWRAERQSGVTVTPLSRVTETEKSPAQNRKEKKRTDPDPVSEESPKEQPFESAETHGVSSPSPIVLVFPTDGRPQEWPLTQAQVDDWQRSYTTIDVTDQCRRAREWVLADPKRQKTAGGMRRFLVNWFNTAVDRRPKPTLAATGTEGRGRTGAPPAGKYDAIEES